MPNSFWYLSLVFISLIVFILVYIKSNHFRKDLAVYIFAAGLSFFGEVIVLILFQAYDYYPHFLKEHWSDNIVGALISQGFIIPIALMAIGAFQLREKWVILIIFVIILIEELFLRLGIYEHNWWLTWYTFGLLLFASYIMKWWRRKLNNPSIWMQFITIYMLFTIILHTITFFLSAVLKLSWYSMDLFESIYKDHTILKTMINIILTIPLTAIVLFSYKYVTLIALFIFTVIFNTVLIKLGILYVIDFKVVIVIAFIHLFIVFIVKRFNDYLFPGEKDFV
ncbi:hypothetical protein RRV45_13015 [Bacillus sp. DTU_2020_1000418_1_SI_GHA_SEK_038]|uniref:hypothetical protein n=1 Tax=Bacillus sp. DTU_2020_1000418_1_SI_GHA_SEK_038 TaxID=3077585 RepID=UPI0028E41525|nr:hypothetical protein [Bacillus sp. DTU_2020_1000418_1_SI_GHA_SEK_038]WNS73839.1 hypothetical protein RRV45_13015 [Bacillus sp. DTU_2020_1000418_1_SI_GHA_SEK_038]